MKLNREWKKLVYWLPAAGWIAVILVMGSVRVDFKGDDINIVSKALLLIKDFLQRRGDCPACLLISENLDRIYHAFEYFILTYFVYYALKKTRAAESKKENFVFAGIIVMSIGILDELHQIFVPTRFCSFFDLMADGFGMILMTLMILLFEIQVGRRDAV
ncbi:MAG: VanZ family protein [bacterium]|nr:VanZ family protein [bacterium]